MDKKLQALRNKQNDVFDSISEILGGLSAPVRIKLIHFLSQGPLTVETLAGKIDQSIANTSMHLRKMLSAQIVNVSIQGKSRLYSLHPAVFPFWESIQDFIQSIDPSLKVEQDELAEELNWSESLKATVKMAKNNDLVILDVRPSEEVVEPLEKINVLNIPSTEIMKNVSKLPKKKPVLVFCRGRFCALSAYVVSELRSKGVQAYRLNESWYSIKSLI